MGEGTIRPAQVARLAPGSRLAARLTVLESASSTMEEARRRLESQSPPFAVLAESQSRGRGRLDRSWHSRPGQDLTFTACLRLGTSLGSLASFTLAVGVGLHRAASELLGEARAQRLSLKWPNDLLVGDRKIAGVLCEIAELGSARDHTVLAGIGWNVNSISFPLDLAGIATSLRTATGGPQDRERVLALALSSIESVALQFERGGFASLASEYAARCRLWGRSVDVDGVRGTLYGVDGTGALVIRHADGTTTIVSSGSVTLV